MVKKYKIGMLVYFSWNGFISNAIKYADGSDWSHIGIITDVQKEEVVIFESTLKGPEFNTYKIATLEAWEANKNAFAHMPNYPKETVLTTLKLKKIAAKYDKEKYGFASYPAIVLFLIMRRLGMKSKIWSILFSQSESERGWLYINLKGIICSELVVRMLYDISNKKMNFEKATGKPWEITSPGDIYSFRDYKWSN